jgi:hypothetical protein
MARSTGGSSTTAAELSYASRNRGSRSISISSPLRRTRSTSIGAICPWPAPSRREGSKRTARRGHGGLSRAGLPRAPGARQVAAGGRASCVGESHRLVVTPLVGGNFRILRIFAVTVRCQRRLYVRRKTAPDAVRSIFSPAVGSCGVAPNTGEVQEAIRDCSPTL